MENIKKESLHHALNKVDPVWVPEGNFIETTNLKKMMNQMGIKDYPSFHRWSVDHYQDFWQAVIHKLHIIFHENYSSIVDLSKGIEIPKWLPDAKLNIIDSCFQADDNRVAMLSQSEKGEIIKTTYGELNQLSNRIANRLDSLFKPGDRIAIIMPMTRISVAIYLAIIKCGCAVVGIPDSFSAKEIETRLNIANVKAVFCQDQIIRGGKALPLYERILDAHAPMTIVVPANDKLSLTLRAGDLDWKNFLSHDNQYQSRPCKPSDYINILFSSGTTGSPKAIPWSQVTPIKCASDAYFHHNLQPGDIFCWPTNLGWMMGPWLIFACFINQITMAIYEGMPTEAEFGQFIQQAKVTHLGVVPTIVKTWRNTACMEGLDFSAIKLFTSTGECSNSDDMLYLMSLANQQPIIEYCGGTEIAGAYITGTVIQPCAPACFTTPALGLDFVILDEDGNETTNGEVALIPPSIGLSTELLNKDHHAEYYAGMPSINGKMLRRHGDQVLRLENGFYRLLGRADDTMNLGGIKISAAEIESTLNLLPEIYETAAIAYSPQDGGPSELVIFAVLKESQPVDENRLKLNCQNIIKQRLNPLFKIEDVIVVDSLPRTASNKVIRKKLRGDYQKQRESHSNH